MSVPIFEKGRRYTVRTIRDELNKITKENLEPYLNGEFEYKGV